MDIFEPQADTLAQKNFCCARLLLKLPNLMVKDVQIKERQKINERAPESDETMTSLILSHTMMIFIRALKLQDTNSRFINEDLYSSLSLTRL